MTEIQKDTNRIGECKPIYKGDAEPAALGIQVGLINTILHCQNDDELSMTLWKLISMNSGHQFFTSKGLPFQYTVKGGELFCDRKEKSITLATVVAAYKKIKAAAKTGEAITGPKKLNMFGAPYIWSILKGIGLTEHTGTP